jgi:hypothetical protein
MESDGVPIWELFMDLKKEWVLVNAKELRELEQKYQNDCVANKKLPQENLEEFME